MPIGDKIEAAKKIGDFLQATVKNGGLLLKYRITVDPPLPEDRDWERPEILVEFAGPDTELLLARGAELLRALELLALEMLRMQGNEHEKVMFDCRGFRAMRLEELRMAARVAAEKVRQTGSPYQFAPMSSRERRIVHRVLRIHEAPHHVLDAIGGLEDPDDQVPVDGALVVRDVDAFHGRARAADRHRFGRRGFRGCIRARRDHQEREALDPHRARNRASDGPLD